MFTAFARGYRDCAEWLSEGSEDDRVREGGWAPEALNVMLEDCTDFYNDNLDALEEYVARGMDWEHAGHDFYLTRNGHGAGYWDRGLGELGTRLSNASRVYGETWEYAGDDGLVYID